MSASRHPLFLIAEFARHCRLPVSTLRYYDRLGLLRPAEIDAHSGYRRYSADQLPAAITIARLRAIGTSPGDIARILAGGDQARVTFAAERRRIRAEITARADALARLDTLARRPMPGPASPHLVDLTGDPVWILAFTARFDDLTSAITRALATLRTQLRRHGVRPSGWGALLPLDLGEQVSGHVFARTSGPKASPAAVTIDTAVLPQGRAIRICHEGSHDELAIAYSAALTEIGKRHSRPASPVIEDYTTLTANDPQRPRVEVTMPMIPGDTGRK